MPVGAGEEPAREASVPVNLVSDQGLRYICGCRDAERGPSTVPISRLDVGPSPPAGSRGCFSPLCWSLCHLCSKQNWSLPLSGILPLSHKPARIDGNRTRDRFWQSCQDPSKVQAAEGDTCPVSSCPGWFGCRPHQVGMRCLQTISQLPAPLTAGSPKGIKHSLLCPHQPPTRAEFVPLCCSSRG